MDGMNVLTISGWTRCPQSLRGIAPDADRIDYVDARSLDEMADTLPLRSYDLVIGWSLGGTLAAELLAREALQASRCVMIAAPAQFVRSKRYHAAMPHETYTRFVENYQAETERTVARFNALVAKGDARAADVVRSLTHHPHASQAARWGYWLHWLGQHTVLDGDYQKVPPTLLIHGKQDHIVPVEQLSLWQQSLPKAQSVILPDASHAPQLHDLDAVRQHIGCFVSGNGANV